MIDLHSHVLPGIDDGAKTFENSIAIARELSEQGVTDLIATPHYICDTIYTSPRSDNAKLLEQLQQTLKEEGIDINVYLGNELYIDESIRKLIENKTVSSLADSEYVLLEFPLNNAYPNYEDIIGDLIQSGYKVVLAHPERYAITQNDFQILVDLYDMGVLMQCNLGSFLGKYDKHAEKTAVKLAKNKMIYGLGSDIHHVRRDDSILKAIKRLKKYYREDELDKLLNENPRKILK